MDKPTLKFSGKARLFFVFVFIASVFAGSGVSAQTNVTLYSVSPTSGDSGIPFSLSGKNFLQCAPLHISTSCNVQFHDTDARRTTISGLVESDTRVTGTVPGGFCPGKYNIRVGELANYSNTVPFTVVDSLAAQSDPALSYCRYISSINPTSAFGGTNIVITGRNLHTSIYFFNSVGIRATVTGTVNATYPVDLGGGNIVQFISRLTFTIPSSLVPGTYTVRVGSNPTSDISNGVDLTVSGDTVAPTISNVRIANIAPTTADVLWNTNEPADSQVEYCLNYVRCGTNSALDSNLKTSHVVGLSGLTPNTVYFIWAKSRDGAGNLKTLGYFVFKTSLVSTPTPSVSSTPPASPTPSISPTPSVGNTPVISNIQISNITRDSALITWDTDVPADSRIMSCFVLFFCSNQLAYDSTLNISHAVNLSGLRADRKYYIQVRSAGVGGNQGYSGIISFRTAPGLVVSNVQVVSTTPSSITVSWDTNYSADSRLSVCTFIFFCYFSTPIVDPTLATSHLMTISGLKSGSTYYYQAISSDPSGYSARSGFISVRIP